MMRDENKEENTFIKPRIPSISHIIILLASKIPSFNN